MKKKSLVLLLLLIFIIFISVVNIYAQEVFINGSQDQQNQTAEQSNFVKLTNPDNLNPDIIKDKATVKWDYLQKEWKTILLSNPVFAKIDGVFTKVSFLFVLLFGEPYSISLILLLVIILWLVFAFLIKNILKSTIDFNLFVDYAIGFGVAIIFAQIGLFRVLVNSFLTLVFAQNLWFGRLMISLVFTGVILGLFYLQNLFKKYMKEIKKASERDKEKFNRKKLDKYIKESDI
jgi:hypothetical protein